VSARTAGDIVGHQIGGHVTCLRCGPLHGSLPVTVHDVTREQDPLPNQCARPRCGARLVRRQHAGQPWAPPLWLIATVLLAAPAIFILTWRTT
jgi:hypothetical protein